MKINKKAVKVFALCSVLVLVYGCDKADDRNDNGFSVPHRPGGSENQAPEAYDIDKTGIEGEGLTVQLLATDPEQESLSFSVNSPAVHFSIEVNGSIATLTPVDVNFQGTDEFIYTVTDAQGATDVASVKLNVLSVNDRPIAGTGLSLEAVEDTPAELILSASTHSPSGV